MTKALYIRLGERDIRTIERAKKAARADRRSLSAWILALIEREIGVPVADPQSPVQAVPEPQGGVPAAN